MALVRYIFSRLALAVFAAYTLHAPRTLVAHECIESSKTSLSVRADASLYVVETITVMCEGNAIKRGITRDIPTRYRTAMGFRFNVGFTLLETLLDGCVMNRVEERSNGVRIFTGNPTACVPYGRHVYTIAYETDRQIGFFEDYDELAWNVTGFDSALDINDATASVVLPVGIKASATHVEGYTGFYGSRGQDYTARVVDGQAEYATTRALDPHEGLTVVVTWPKGCVVQRNVWWRALVDNAHIALLLFMLLVIIVVDTMTYMRTRGDQRYATIIPLFHPPEDADPGALDYVLSRTYKSTQLAAVIVNMAVRGFLTIEYRAAHFWGSSTYILKRRSDAAGMMTDLEKNILETGFASGDTLTLSSPSSASADTEKLRLMAQRLRSHYELTYNIPYFQRPRGTNTMGGVMLTLMAAGGAFFIVHEGYIDAWTWILLAIHGIVHGIFMCLAPAYTAAGQAFKEKIEGFKLFLATTETERLNLVGTPPTRTPELFECYLPYAIALGLEKQWSAQFASMFRERELAGELRAPSWYIAPHALNALDLALLSRSLSRGLSTALPSVDISGPMSSSRRPPGSSSSSGGGGFAGSGGGGGGVGGW